MELLNSTKLATGYAPGLAKDGHEFIVVVVKGTFRLPANGQAAEMNVDQIPLTEADVYTGEPGYSAPLYESDYAPVKPFCDVLLNGSAYAPGAKPAREVEVGIKVGRVAKAFRVVGERTWVSGVGGIGPGPARPFVRNQITYDTAFGGTDRHSLDEKDHDAFMDNPSGIGFRKSLTSGPLNGTPMPCTEERKDAITSPLGRYRPMSFGSIARSWEARAKYAGTYDDHWIENVFPFLPEDFDDRYFQCAPDDQQTDHLMGGEVVTLINLTPDGRRVFEIPNVDIPIGVHRRGHEFTTIRPNIDTVLFEPDQDRFCLMWRHRIPIARSLFEVLRVTVGEMSPGRKRAQRTNKAYYAGLAHAVRGELDRQLEIGE